MEATSGGAIVNTISMKPAVKETFLAGLTQLYMLVIQQVEMALEPILKNLKSVTAVNELIKSGASKFKATQH
jgi:hypothetical protein